MRPHIVTSAVFSLSRLTSTSATTRATKALITSNLPLKAFTVATCPPLRLFSSTASQCTSKPSTTMATPILDLVKSRRTYYVLNKELPISKDRVQEIVKESLLHTPSSFNSQSNRIVVLFGAEHDKLWGIATDILKAIVPEDAWEHTAQRMNGFKAAAGTVLFFEDQKVVDTMQEKFALYADKFPIWAQQSDAMAQYVVWTALTAEGVGANLQHYNPLVDAKVASEWGIPDNWKLNAQLVFGGRSGEAGPKDFQPIEERYKVFGA
ncbi:Nitroreductase [Annulohypoxylon maeteangense]|uniref:Nitroreductase n=1 Tax=Annulohypoxylon maeteangense TaxID=1927788 RepID=UPI002008D764|nr:Nitroreductase [Annulohypoxylon maeteangense]KAI0884392.1 Nitroreductase [Annulohypoxylon maeteangense]